MNPIYREAIPLFVREAIERLDRSGFKAFVVGGAVRDMMMGRESVSDWDVATSADPARIHAVFRDTPRFSLKHDTVTLVMGEKHLEITPFKGAEGRGRSIEEDLRFRDFTINAMAYDPMGECIIDPFGGKADIKRGLVRAVEEPRERFLEDPIRLLRAVRIAAETRFRIEPVTQEVIRDMADLVAGAAKERMRDELMKILLVPAPSKAFSMLRRTGLMDYILPELLEGYGKRQNPKYHRFTIYRHIMETLDRVEAEPVLRLVALFHDIGKPRVRKKVEGVFRFHGHEDESAILAAQIMDRLKFSRNMIQEVTHLIRNHVVGYHSGWGDSAVRRFVRRVGPENLDRLIAFRRADLLAHGREDIPLHELSELERRVEEVKGRSMAIGIRDLAIDGHEVMEILNLSPGPEVGRILNHLLERVTEAPQLNTRRRLITLLEEELRA
ncbi:MAG: HD domain-containing protein [Deltaproteobacteria bacterium]|nr:HD domain-containing protein [Deltaproteobacteria bacterium]MBW2130460.1 HD domain-containing protein [Deltaproteobacteria bacterium]MBW2303592.1 HD domain-containing protein [Deltaproteobacteria bacterium]